MVMVVVKEQLVVVEKEVVELIVKEEVKEEGEIEVVFEIV